MAKAPNFWEILSKSLLRSSKTRGALAFFPWLFILLIIGPIISAHFVQTTPNIGKTETVSVILSALLTATGFLGALTIYAMTHVMSVCLTRPFSSFLIENDLFDEFIFFPQFILMIQIIFMSSCVFSICIHVIFPCLAKFILFGNLGSFVYVAIKTWGLVDMMRNVSWHFSDFMKLLEESEERE